MQNQASSPPREREMGRNSLIILDRTENGLVIIGQGCLIIMALIQIVDVIGLQLRMPLPMAAEMIENLMLIVVCVSIAYIQRQRRHIRMELLTDRFPVLNRVSSMLTLVFGFLIFSIVTYKMGTNAWHSLQVNEVAEGQISLPLYVGKIMATVGFGFFSIRLFVQVVQEITNTFFIHERVAGEQTVMRDLNI